MIRWKMKRIILYKCDPEKNTGCSKTHCKYYLKYGECEGTSKEEYAVLDDKGKPIVILDIETE